MSRNKMIVLGLMATVVFSIVSAGSALATVQWLHEGEVITSAAAGLLDGSVVLVHKGGLLGNADIKCTGQFHGTFGPGAADSITEALGLSGEKTNIKCEFISGACGIGTAASVKFLHLPWKSELLLPGTPAGIWDKISSSGTGTPGYETECVSLKIAVKCEHTVSALFTETGLNGAILEFKGAESEEATCSDAGKGTLESKIEALGFTITNGEPPPPSTEWLEGGKAIVSAQSGLLDGTIELVHTGGLLGSAVMKCTGQWHGTFGPGSADTVTELLGLSGEKNTIKCEFVSGACGVGAAASVTALHFPWSTRLELPGTPEGTWDKISSSGAGTPGYSTECVSLKIAIKCEHSVRSRFESNGTNGAILDFHPTESEEASCSDGGKGTLGGSSEALGFTIS
jgi:hypothetical protein